MKPDRKLHIYALKVAPFATAMANFRSLTLQGAKLDSLLSLGSILPNLTQLHIERSPMSWKPGVDLVALSRAFPHLTDLSLRQCWLQIPSEEFFASHAKVFERLESLRLFLRCALEPDDYFLVLSLFPAEALRRFSVCIVSPIRPPLPLEVVQFLCARFENLVHCELGRENEVCLLVRNSVSAFILGHRLRISRAHLSLFLCFLTSRLSEIKLEGGRELFQERNRLTRYAYVFANISCPVELPPCLDLYCSGT